MATWATRDRAEAAEAQVKELKAEVRRLTSDVEVAKRMRSEVRHLGSFDDVGYWHPSGCQCLADGHCSVELDAYVKDLGGLYDHEAEDRSG